MRRTKEMRKQNGLTLIALIVTIIIMLILVTITVNFAINGGVLDYAKKAKLEMENTIGYQENLANELFNFADGNGGGSSGGNEDGGGSEEPPIEEPPVLPTFTYTGEYEIVNDDDTPYTEGNKNWKIRFLTSGKLTIRADVKR